MPTEPAESVRLRLPSIDVVRGAVLVLMALDHARHFFGNMPPPEHMELTTPALFLTRWVTHFCAPLFFLLAGTSAWIHGSRAGLPALRRFLGTRGAWLIVLELTVIGFAWSFRPGNSFAGVLWCLGWAFLALAAVAGLGPRFALVAGTAMIALHGLTDDVSSESFGPAGFLWGLAHQAGGIELPGGGFWFVLFPWVPWVGVMWVGYGLGPLFARPQDERRRRLVRLGLAATALFVVLRATNLYGNPAWAFQPGGPGHFVPQATWARTCIAFLNTEKYPPSLQFLLMTLGPSLVLLGLLARLDSGPGPRGVLRVLHVYGGVPFLFYVLHLYLLHLGAWALGAGLGQPVDWLGWGGGRRGPGYGIDLAGVWGAWLASVAVLYLPCAWWGRLRARRGDWWLKYL